eukprot:10799137-Karenia_brevis.AAC.1
MSGTEALVAQGFPVHPEYNVTSGSGEAGELLCSFQAPSSSRKNIHCRQQAGNSMHTCCVGIALVHGYLCHQREEMPP